MSQPDCNSDSAIPIPELDCWTERLTQIAQQPLEYCEDFPRIAERFESWWAGEVLDRPIFIGAANGNPVRPITRRIDLLEHPEEWLAAKKDDLQETHYVGDALPNIHVDFGPVVLAGFFGGRREHSSDTAWTHPFIENDWSNEPSWNLAEDNPLWTTLRMYLRMVAEDAAGRYLVCSPDCGSSADVLLNLRGATGLCMDVIEQPDQVRRAIGAIYPVWHKVFAEFYRTMVELRGAGLFHWIGLWSNRPYHTVSCDFNFMIGPKEFQSICLPEIARQAASVGRACFHLDGPGAARHIDSLLDIPEIQAIQFTPGESTPSALAWIPMFRKIQARGRSLLAFCPAGEMLELSKELAPEGLALRVNDRPSVKQLDELYRTFCGQHASARRVAGSSALESAALAGRRVHSHKIPSSRSTLVKKERAT